MKILWTHREMAASRRLYESMEKPEYQRWSHMAFWSQNDQTQMGSFAHFQFPDGTIYKSARGLHPYKPLDIDKYTL